MDDPLLAAQHFNLLILSIPLNKAMFHGRDLRFTLAELARCADEGVRVYLAAYGTWRSSGRGCPDPWWGGPCRKGLSDVGKPLAGGHVGGAVRIGDTVRRPTGPWTPAVHALLDHLSTRVPHVPRVLGFDEQGREVLDYLPGRVIDPDTQMLTAGQLVAVARWTRAFHEAVAGFSHPGPWRYFPVANPTLIGHNDIAPYNVCFDDDELVGVFDWDMSGPTTPLFELAFIAWNCVPLWRDLGTDTAARRLALIASGYGGFDPRRILHAVPERITAMLDGIPVGAAAGDQGLANLMIIGEPDRSRELLAELVARIPAIGRSLR